MLSHTGLAYSMHFCGEMLTDFSVVKKTAKACGCQMPQAENDCCSDQQVESNTDDSQLVVFDFKLDAPKFTILAAVIPQLLAHIFAPFSSYFFRAASSLPPHPKVPVYLFIGLFRI